MKRLTYSLLGIFLLSIPICYFVEVSGINLGFLPLQSDMRKTTIAIINSYIFSCAYDCLYLYPFLFWLFGTKKLKGPNGALTTATVNWVLWLTCFTQIVFQIPHNLFPEQLHAMRGTALEWPFYAYGLSDDRWSTYVLPGTDEQAPVFGLAPSVKLINWNDGLFGVLVLLLYALQRNSGSVRTRVAFYIALLFRDATLWRETVEYMWDHHRLGYPYTSTNLRSHAIVCLWTVNGLWLVAPVVSAVWVYVELVELLHPSGAKSVLDKDKHT